MDEGAGVHGRGPSAAGAGSAGSVPGRTRNARDVRGRTQWREQPVDAVRTTERLATTRERGGATHESRLSTADPTAGGPNKRIVLVMDHFEHACPGFTLRGVRAGRGVAHRRATGNPLHAQARQLAEHARDWDQGDGRPVPEPSPFRPRSPTPRSPCLAGAKEPRSRAGGLAIHGRRRADQTEITLPVNTKVTAC